MSGDDDDFEPCLDEGGGEVARHLHGTEDGHNGDVLLQLPPFPPRINPIPLQQLRVKEIILVGLALALLVCSIALFFKHWKKNYRDINQLPYYAYLYQKEDVVDVVPPPPPPPPPISPAALSLGTANPNFSFPIRDSFPIRKPGGGGTCSVDGISVTGNDDEDSIGVMREIPSAAAVVRPKPLLRSHSVRTVRTSTLAAANYKLSDIFAATTARLAAENHHVRQMRTLSRTGTEPSMNLGRVVAVHRPSPPQQRLLLQRPQSGNTARPARYLPPKRASSDVHWRLHNSGVVGGRNPEFAMMRRNNSGLAFAGGGEQTSPMYDKERAIAVEYNGGLREEDEEEVEEDDDDVGLVIKTNSTTPATTTVTAEEEGPAPERDKPSAPAAVCAIVTDV